MSCLGEECPYPTGSLCARYPCAGRSKLTVADMQQMWADGEPMAAIAAKTRRELGWSKERTREAVFGGAA